MVSVVMPVYNGEKYMKTAIESVLAQDYECFELIIIDDGSTDATWEIATSYANVNTNIRVIQQKNSGPGSARNYGMSIAQGDFFAFIDADDQYVKDKLRTQRQIFNMYPNISVVWGDYFLADSNLQIKKEVSPDYVTNKRENLLAYMLFRNVITLPPNIMFRRICYDAGFRYKERVCHDEDYYLLLNLLEHYNFYYLNKPLYIYRKHENNLTNNTKMLHKREMEILSLYTFEKINSIIEETDFSKGNKLRLLGKIYMKFEDYTSALSCFNKIETKLKNWKDNFYIGNNQYCLGRYKDAISSYLNAEKLQQNAAELYNNLGCAYAMIGNPLCKKMFQMALSLFPMYGDAKSNLVFANKKIYQKETYRLTIYELRKSYKNNKN